MTQCISFPPLITNKSQALVLGSMPGKESLLKQEYYAHPRNAFWHIMHELFNTGTLNVPYAERTTTLKEKGVAVWDVINSCDRPSSLDADIVKHSVKLNDFNSLLTRYVNIKAIFLNGQKAHDLFRKNVLPHLSESSRSIAIHALPSTSPANASISFEDKIEQWSLIKKYTRSPSRKL